MQRRRLEQRSLSTPGVVSESQASCEHAESTSSFEQCALETTGSSSSQVISESDGELVDEETSDTVTEAEAVTEADDAITEDVVEVVNLDFLMRQMPTQQLKKVTIFLVM